MVLNIDGKKCFDNKEVANQFNKFFTRVAAKLVDELPKQECVTYGVDSDKFRDQYKNVVPDSFKLQEISEEFVKKELNSLSVYKSTGLDGIQHGLLKMLPR